MLVNYKGIKTCKRDCVIFPSLNKEGTLDSVAQHGIQRGWLSQGVANKWFSNLCNLEFMQQFAVTTPVRKRASHRFRTSPP